MQRFPAARIAAILLTVIIAGCAPARIPDGINDPYEAQNRATHEASRSTDLSTIEPLSKAYAEVVPKPVRQGVKNFADNADMPGMVVNDILQLSLEDAASNTFRFLINTTIGIGGLFDPATQIGLGERSSDFGQTLHVWGVGEGAYMEVPFIGPTTERDLVGKVVDVFLDPLGYVAPRNLSYARTGARLASKVGDRYTYASTVDSILRDSADSYAQTRSIYLQNRRYELRGEATEEDYLDPYADQ